MKPQNIRELSVDEINTRIRTLRDELCDLNIKKSTRQLEKSHQIRDNKRNTARLLTILKEKQTIN